MSCTTNSSTAHIYTQYVFFLLGDPKVFVLNEIIAFLIYISHFLRRTPSCAIKEVRSSPVPTTQYSDNTSRPNYSVLTRAAAQYDNALLRAS